MKDILVKDILEICKDAKLICGNQNTICRNFSKDTRTIQKDDVYIGIKGERFDGNQLYKEAIKNGASVCILQDVKISEQEKEQYKYTSIILVEDTIKTLQEIAKKKRNMYNIPVIAITGSVGKTSTKDIIANVMAKQFHILRTEGNLNNHIGLPLTILKLKDEEMLIVEMGMNQAGEIKRLTEIAKPDVAVITNVGTAHIGLLGSRENILKAKLEILEGLNKNGTLVINSDNDLLHNWYLKEKDNYKIITYGIKEKSDITGKEAILQEKGSILTAAINEKEFKINIPVAGEPFLYNALCAISVAKIFDIQMENVIKGIENLELTKKRMEIKQSKCGATVINDSYNANFDSMKGAIDHLGKLKNTRKIAVLGDMLELGEFSQKLHEDVGKCVADNKIDILICKGEESKNIVKIAKENGIDNIYQCNSNEEIIELLEKILKKEDTVLLKASNSLKFYEIAEAICK